MVGELVLLFAILIGATVVFFIGWYFGRLTSNTSPVRRPITEFRSVGLEDHDVKILDDALGTGNVDPSSWGKIKLGPLTDEDLSQIAGRINENTQTQADTATLLLELKRIRLKESGS